MTLEAHITQRQHCGVILADIFICFGVYIMCPCLYIYYTIYFTVYTFLHCIYFVTFGSIAWCCFQIWHLKQLFSSIDFFSYATSILFPGMASRGPDFNIGNLNTQISWQSYFHNQISCTVVGKMFCGEFQRVPLKFHILFLTHTLKDMILYKYRNFTSS